MDAILQTLARELERSPEHVQNVVTLIDEGATIPFIARYRKELHGSMDEQLLRRLADRLQYLRNLEARKGEVAAAIENQGKLTQELSDAIAAAATLAEVEDLYRPYKQKRRTRATIAREKGLEPLVRLLSAQGPAVDPRQAALDFLDPDKGVETAEDALQGASDILAEEISDDADIRRELRQLYLRRGMLASRAAAKEPEDTVYRLYYDFKVPVGRAQGHQVLAVNRGEREGVLKVTVELDPGYRMGCKVAVVDGTGKVLDTAVVYPTYGERQKQEAIAKLSHLVRKHGVEHIAIGNGTASRETEQMAVELIHRLGGGLSYMIVSEAGASVYSASKLAAEEFPEYDVNLRSAVSIARRLQDPLAELVKIDPKAIGVGQYQHDMPQARLGEALDGVVEDCVNAVGVDVNTASPSLLQRVSGLTAATAKNLVKYREENGAFTTRRQVLKVPKLGPKAFEQCAGFLRVPESASVLDNTGVHPESYAAAEALLAQCGYTLSDVRAGAMGALKEKAEAMGLEALARVCGVGVPTLADIIKELMKPGRDPRDELPAPILRTDVMEARDLKPGMELQGTVRNVIDFGAFVDIGVHQDGLVHISKLPQRVKHPSQLLSVGDVVTVWVLEVDEKKKRISLTMKKP